MGIYAKYFYRFTAVLHMKNKIKYILITIGVIAIAFLDYLKTFIISEQGITGFYWLSAHLYLILIWLSCIIVTLLVIKIRPHPFKKIRFINEYGWIILLSLFVNVLVSASYFFLLECTTIIAYKEAYSASAVYINVLERIFSMHIPVIGMLTGYTYLEEKNKLKQNLEKAEKLYIQYQIKTLRNQVAPHFLFNNLNVLASLIQSNTKDADTFLTRFSSLYRYTLKGEEIVTLNEELNNLEDYTFLLKHRFENAYKFSIHYQDTIDQYAVYLLSNTLQTLLENITKHNAGNYANPLLTTISIGKTEMKVSNTIIPKITENPSSKIGLKNLQERYLLLSGKQLTISNDGVNFTVTIPFLNLKKV